MSVRGEPERPVGPIDPAQLARLQALLDQPADHIDELRRDVDLQVDIARADSLGYLTTWFSTGEAGWQADLERSGSIGQRWAGVEWSFDGIHDIDGGFNGLHATHRNITVHAFTLMGLGDAGRFTIRRYVDWAGLYAQLGLTLNWRVPINFDDEQRMIEHFQAREH